MPSCGSSVDDNEHRIYFICCCVYASSGLKGSAPCLETSYRTNSSTGWQIANGRNTCASLHLSTRPAVHAPWVQAELPVSIADREKSCFRRGMATTRTTWRILLDGDQPQSVFLSGHFHRPSDGACSQQKFPKTNDCFPNEFQLNNAPLIMPPPPAPQPSPLSNSRPGRRAANPPPRRPTPRAAPTPSAPASEPMASATGSGWAATRAALVRGRTPIPEHVKSRSLWQSYMCKSASKSYMRRCSMNGSLRYCQLYRVMQG